MMAIKGKVSWRMESITDITVLDRQDPVRGF